MKTLHAHRTYQKKHISFFIFMVLLLLMIYGKVSAQKGETTAPSSYLRVGIGYGFPSGSHMVNENSTDSYTYSPTNNYSSSSAEGVYGTLGTGLVFNTGYTYLSSKRMGVDLSLQYLSGKKYEGSHSSTFNGSTSISNSSIHAQGILFTPSFIASIGEKKLKPYVQVGVVAGLITVKAGYETSSNQSDSEYKGGLSFGFRGCIGFDAAISDRTIFFTEVAFTSMSYFPKKAIITTRSNGSTTTKTIEFVKENNSSNQSSSWLSDSFPLGTLAFTTGIKFRINKSKI